MSNIVRIEPDRLTEAQRVIFGDCRVTGPAIAESAGLRNVTLWSFLNRTGLPIPDAEKLANVLSERAAHLLEAATCIRNAAALAVRAARSDQPVLSER